MGRKLIQDYELMDATEKLLLEQGYGGFNFSALSKMLNVGRTTLYEYYATKDDLIVAYMDQLMTNYKNDLSVIVSNNDAKTQLIQLIQLMIEYSHIHNIIKIIPLLQSKSAAVKKLKNDFIHDHIHIIHEIEAIINYGKEESLIREEIPTDVLANLLFNTINKPSSLKIDNHIWAKWIWEIIYDGVKK